MNLSFVRLAIAATISFVSIVNSFGAPSERSRQIVSLDGTWQIAEGTMDAIPKNFEHNVPVPGLVDLANPPFVDPAPKVADRSAPTQKDPRRDAFWYRRTLNVSAPIPAVARIKVGKATFGTRVILNGSVLGDHMPSFTPGWFDAKPALKTGDNELIIRVGADRDAVGPAYPSGFDFEKERYIPGIFDSVELIMSGTPSFVSVQTVPDLANKAVRVQAVLRNAGPATRTPIQFLVRESKSGQLAGQLKTEPVSIESGEEKTIDIRISLERCHLWSPEDPFLYSLEADTGADQFKTRFGMREFKLDPATGRAMLNGKPYPMRGSNFTVYRFFEDAECADLPWRKDWVTLLHQRVKEMHWNCLRYCIGFPPEAWYDIADETGILIQDEFPIWYGGKGWSKWPKELKSDQLAIEYAQWMRERWNHPCVVIWDASNETASSETGPAIEKVRSLDLSGRPWDNSYGQPAQPGDVFESHPYHFNPSFRLSHLAKADPVPQGNEIHNDSKHAVIINEYGWHWVNRDGSPTTLTREIYDTMLGTNATPEQRFRMQATWLAADTEFWRAHRKPAAVVHFTMLGYSRPTGQTCDHWTQGGVKKLEWEPQFFNHVGDAFAPVGLCIDFWKDAVIKKTDSQVPVILINDLDRPWSGPVKLRLQAQGATTPVFELSQNATLEPLGQCTLQFQVSWPDSASKYELIAELPGDDGKPVHSLRELTTVDTAFFGLAYKKAVSASATHSAAYAPANAVDGDAESYWSSPFADPAWFAVDLGESHQVSHAHIIWERAYSKEFSLQVSADGQNWTTVYNEINGKGGESDIHFTPSQARYVRIFCTKRGTEWGHAIREFQLFDH